MARERITGGIVGKGAKNVNSIYRQMLERVSMPSASITQKDISKIIQSGNKTTLKQFEKQIRKNPNK